MTRERLTADEKRRLARDGYLILRDIIPPERVVAARRVLNEAMGALRGSAMRAVASRNTEALEPSVSRLSSAGTEETFTNLFNETPLISIMTDLLGPVSPAQGCLLYTSPSPRDPL